MLHRIAHIPKGKTSDDYTKVHAPPPPGVSYMLQAHILCHTTTHSQTDSCSCSILPAELYATARFSSCCQWMEKVGAASNGCQTRTHMHPYCDIGSCCQLWSCTPIKCVVCWAAGWLGGMGGCGLFLLQEVLERGQRQLLE